MNCELPRLSAPCGTGDPSELYMHDRVVRPQPAAPADAPSSSVPARAIHRAACLPRALHLSSHLLARWRAPDAGFPHRAVRRSTRQTPPKSFASPAHRRGATPSAFCHAAGSAIPAAPFRSETTRPRNAQLRRNASGNRESSAHKHPAIAREIRHGPASPAWQEDTAIASAASSNAPRSRRKRRSADTRHLLDDASESNALKRIQIPDIGENPAVNPPTSTKFHRTREIHRRICSVRHYYTTIYMNEYFVRNWHRNCIENSEPAPEG